MQPCHYMEWGIFLKTIAPAAPTFCFLILKVQGDMSGFADYEVHYPSWDKDHFLH